MNIKFLIKRPIDCPCCGGEIADIIWGYPLADAQEKHRMKTGHQSVLGGCCLPPDGHVPEFECLKCGKEFIKLSFILDCKASAYTALHKTDDNSIFTGVSLLGLHQDCLVYEPVIRPDVHWDGATLIFVNQMGTAEVVDSIDNWKIVATIGQEKKQIAQRDKFYRDAARRSLRHEEYYDNVRRCGWYQGKRAYVAVLKREYQLDPPKTGMYPYVLVDESGTSELQRDIFSLKYLQRNR